VSRTTLRFFVPEAQALPLLCCRLCTSRPQHTPTTSLLSRLWSLIPSGGSLPESVWRARHPGDPAGIREMLANLIFNAVDAMPNGGTIAVRARRAGASVRLEVSDTGTGMSDEVRQHCLEPFFTTKGPRPKTLARRRRCGRCTSSW